MNKTYKIRYSVERWGKPPVDKGTLVRPGLRVSKTYGYTDVLFLVSILRDKDGNPESVVMTDTETGPALTQEIIDLVRSNLDHYEKEHLFKEGATQ